MFDFAGSEIVLIGIVALVLIGPKDLPVAVKGISAALKKMRRMAGEFQTHMDEMVREADLGEVRDTLSSLRGLNVKSALRNAVDPDDHLRSAFADPFRSHPVQPVMTPLGGAEAGTEVGAPGGAPGEIGPAIAVPPRPRFVSAAPAPAFIPPGAAMPAPIQPAAPAFIPPGAGSAPPDEGAA